MPTGKGKNILAIGDFHCGALTGLTPPKFQYAGSPFKPLQAEMWAWFSENTNKQKYDTCILNGDLVDGSGVKNGAESISTDMGLQCDMALNIIERINAKEFIIVSGTPTHTTTRDGVDVEEVICQRIGARMVDQLFLDVHGTVFDFKHHTSQSNVPLRSMAGLRNDVLWNLLHSDNGDQPRADVLLRSHVHHFKFMGDESRLAMTLPCLQAGGSRYGRRFAGNVTIGFVEFNVTGKGVYTRRPRIAKMAAAKSPIVLS